MSRRNRLILSVALLVGLSCGSAYAAEKAATLDQLLKQVRQNALAESKSNKAREQEFARNKSQQGRML